MEVKYALCDAITVLNRLDGRYTGITPTSSVDEI